MAGCARRRCGRHVCAGKREPGDAVIEGSGVPTLGGVAGGTVGSGKGSAGSGVRRIIRLLPGGEVATGIAAIGRSNLQVVVAIDVAGRAEHVGMPIGERKSGGTVVEFAIGPGGDGMASGTSGSCGGESRGEVVGHGAAQSCRFIPVSRMAGYAVGRIQSVVIVDVAGSTGSGRGRLVRADKRETRNAVIEGSGIPSLRGVTVGAVGGGKGRTGSGVNGSGGLLPSGEVAARIAAVGGSNRKSVVIVDMAGGTWNVGMAIGQQEASGVVVESNSGPCGGVVAISAIGSGEGRTGLGVRRIGGLLPAGEMATGVAAIRGSDLQVVVVVDVAGSAGNIGVPVG